MTRSTVHHVRHGEVHNPDGVLYGRLPGFHLSVAGRAMADTLGTWFADHKGQPGFDVGYVVASPLERAQETAAPVGAALGLEVATDDRLLEAGNAFEGEPVRPSTFVKRLPRLWNPVRPSWGEPYTGIALRMTGAVHAARDAAGGRDAVCVSHQLPVYVMRLAAEGRRLWHSPRTRQCALASVTSLTLEGDDVVAVAYAEPCGPVGRQTAGA